ncbi:replication protein A 32 kDa subunit isoform X2 [Bemisia tabaci]|uniref:replication protein A 32 kDa subunit isoform X2 n=1 Tax=Bemisia tabaci TaxID=7038 RepID=UPI0008F9BD88|nr:PREDICTED: replication protein A 32 kDa subunit isoform X2 [Bemisia tabaci]
MWRRNQVKRSQNIVPVTIKQIIEAPEEGLNIAGVESNLVKVIGVIRSIESTSLKAVYRLEDTTGVITVIDWIKEDGDPDKRDDIQIVENQYHRAIGTIRTTAGEKHMIVIDLQPLTDLAEITSHMLEIIYVALKAEEYEKAGDFEMKKEPGLNGEISGIGGTNASANPNSYYDSNTNGLNFNPTQQKVFSVIQQSNDENGITPQEIHDALPQKMPMKDITNILEWLVNEGHVYTAIDDNHFRSTY